MNGLKFKRAAFVLSMALVLSVLLPMTFASPARASEPGSVASPDVSALHTIAVGSEPEFGCTRRGDPHGVCGKWR